MAGRTLKASVVIGGLIDQSFKTVLTDSKRGFTQLGATIKSLNKNLESTNTEVNKAKEKGGAVDLLTGRYKALKETVKDAKKAVKELNRAEQFKNRMDRGNRQAQFMAGRATMGAFVGGGFLKSVINPASAMQLEQTRLQSLGLQEKDKQAGFEFGRRLKTFGSSQIQNAEIMRDSLSIFGNLKEAQRTAPTIAKMNFALRVLLGKTEEEASRQAADAQRVIDARGGATSIEKFNQQTDFIQRATMASGGRVTGSQWRELIQHGGLAAKGMDNNALFFGEMPMIQEMGASQVGTGETAIYNNLYQGKTTKRAIQKIDDLGLVADRSKVHYDKNGAAAQIGPGAIAGADIFRRSQFEWMMKVLIPALAKHGITSQKQIIDTFGTIVTNSTGANLMANRYINRRQIERDLTLGAKADGVDQSYQKAKGTAKGQEMGVQAQLTNARLNLGQTIMPTYISLLQKANTALEKFNGFVTTHPKLTRAMMIGTVAVTGALAVSVPLLFTAGAAMSLYGNITAITARRQALFANSQLRATEATLMGTEAETAASLKRGTSFRAMFKGMGSVASRFTGNISGLFTEAGVAVSALFSPVGLTVGALVAGGVLIWKYWEPIKAFFSGFADGLSESFAPIKPLFSTIGSYISPVIGWFENLLVPVHSTKAGLHSASSAGHRFGEALGAVINVGAQIFKTFTPIGWMFTAMSNVIPYVAHLIIDNWSSISPIFDGIGRAIGTVVGLFEKWVKFALWFDTKGAQVFGKFLSHPISEGGALLSGSHTALKSFLGGAGYNTPQNQSLSYPANILQPVKPKSDEEYLPKIPSIGSASSRRGDVHVTHHITINQQPGQSHEDLVRELSDKLYPAQSPSAGAPLHDGLIGSAY